VARQHPVPMRFVAIKDTFAESGKPEELLKKYGLTAADILREAQALLG
jgi:transketolase